MVLEGLTWQKGGKTRRFSPSRELLVLTCDWRIRGAGVPFYKGQSLRPCAERHAISVSGAQERARVGPVPREFTRRRGEKNLTDGYGEASFPFRDMFIRRVIVTRRCSVILYIETNGENLSCRDDECFQRIWVGNLIVKLPINLYKIRKKYIRICSINIYSSI